MPGLLKSIVYVLRFKLTTWPLQVPSNGNTVCLCVSLSAESRVALLSFFSRSWLLLGSDLCPLWSLTLPASSPLVVTVVRGDCWCPHRLYNPLLTLVTTNDTSKLTTSSGEPLCKQCRYILARQAMTLIHANLSQDNLTFHLPFSWKTFWYNTKV